MCAYLASTFNSTAVVVGNGQLCPYGYLFDETVHSLRSQSNVRGEAVVARYTIKGRPDVITVQSVSEAYMRHQVKVAFEIKTVKQMNGDANESECEREAILHLIGLNVNNTGGSPPVILTNLDGKHKVIYVELAASDSLGYVIHIVSFKKFAAAVDHAHGLLNPTLGFRDCVTRDFGRGCSPLATARSSGSADEGVGIGGGVLLEEFDELGHLLEELER